MLKRHGDGPSASYVAVNLVLPVGSPWTKKVALDWRLTAAEAAAERNSDWLRAPPVPVVLKLIAHISPLPCI